ncbi:MAG: TonB-dependent receptor [Pseudomonadota bacterium]
MESLLSAKATRKGRFVHKAMGAVSIAAIGAALSTPTLAQTAPPEAPDEDIIFVTANKREQNLQDAALAVTVIGGETLEAPAVSSLADIANRVPGLSVNQISASENIVSIRGLVPTNFRVNSFPLVATYIDETPISEPITPNIALYDLERVEVLRGPQGTLYGESSMGGTIRYVTRAPNLTKYEASVDSTISTTKDGGENYAVNGVVNIPLVESTAALRLVASYEDDGGFVDNEFLGTEDIDAFERLGLRGSLLLTPIDPLSIRITGIYQDFETGDAPRVFNQPFSLDLHPALPGIGDTAGFRQFEGRQDQELTSLNATIEYDLGPGTLTSATTYYDKSENVLQDETQTTIDLNAFLGGAAVIQTGTPVAFDGDIEVFTQELRYTARLADRVDLTVGGYYRNRELASNLQTSSPEFGQILSGLFMVDYDGFLQSAVEQSEYEQFAVFGQATLSVTDTFRITGGLRYFDEDIQGEATLGQLDPNTLTAVIVAPDVLDDSESDVLFKAGVEFDVTPDILLYTNFGQGFRPGGVNARFNPFVSAELSPRTFGSDSVNSYDVGVKSQFFDGTLTLNAEAYFIDYDDPQFTDTRDPQFQPVTNAGAAESYGIEIEAFALLTDNWTLGGALSWNNAEFTESALADGLGGFVINDGQELPVNRDTTFNAFTQYRHPVMGGRADLVLDADISYASDALSDIRDSADPLFRVLDSYTVGNLSLGLETDQYRFAFFVNNLGNEVIELGGDDASGVLRNKPRTIGVRLGASF